MPGLGGGCLLVLAIAYRNNSAAYKYWFLAGVLAGLAHLTRADGVLFLLIAFLLLGWQFWQTKSAESSSNLSTYAPAVGLLLVGLFSGDGIVVCA